MQSDIWDANGAIPMWGPSAMEASVIEQMNMEVGVQMDDQTDERSGEPVDVAAVSAISHLSRREHEVLQELVDGKSHEAAAQDLYISHHTFRTHVKNILTKLNAHSSIEAVSIAVCAGVRPSRLRDANQETDGSMTPDSTSTE
jgi:DNA-binding NarL/FixJ family response regulator